MGKPQNCLPGPDWCKTSGIYVFRSVTGRALNPNKWPLGQKNRGA